MIIKHPIRPLMLAIAFAFGCTSSPKSEKTIPAYSPSEREELQVIKPLIGYTPDISNDAKNNLRRLNALYAKIDSTIKSYPSYDIAKQHLSDKQIEIYENEEKYSKEDHLDVSTWGCSWYCAGFPDTVIASSALKAVKQLNYGATNAHDFSLRTAWVAGGKANGIGESITYQFAKGTPAITTIEIFNGYMKSEHAWKDYARVKKLKMYLNSKPYAILSLKDVTSKQIFKVGKLHGTDAEWFLKFEIAEVFKGGKYNDVAISELEFEGIHVH